MSLIDFDTCIPEDFGFDVSDPEFSWTDYTEAIEFAKSFQYLQAEGLVDLEKDLNDTIRLYPIT